MLMPSMSAGVMAPRSESVSLLLWLIIRGLVVLPLLLNKDLDEKSARNQREVQNGNDGKNFVSRYSKLEEDLISDNNDNVSVYMQLSAG